MLFCALLIFSVTLFYWLFYAAAVLLEGLAIVIRAGFRARRRAKQRKQPVKLSAPDPKLPQPFMAPVEYRKL